MAATSWTTRACCSTCSITFRSPTRRASSPTCSGSRIRPPPTTISPAEQQVIRDPISPLNPTQVALVTAHQAAIRGTIMSMAEERTMVASLTKEIGWPYAFPAMGSGDLFSIDALFLRAVVGPSAVFPTSRDYFRNVVTNTNPGRNAVLVGALRTVITALTTQYGTTDPTQ